MSDKKLCKYAAEDEDGYECDGYYSIDCPYQDVDYNYYNATDGFKEINVVNCTKQI